MEAFALYLFRSAIWITGFAMVYFLFLRNERFFLIKRFYLVSGILISFFFPLISVHYQVTLPAQVINPVDIAPAENPAFVAAQQVSSEEPFDYRYILLFLYLAGALFFAFRSIRFTGSLIRTINKANINYQGQAKLIRASEFSFPFSFFNYVFVNPSISETEVEEIMNHELVHVRQKHWFDLLLIELLRLFQWVNPFVWIYTRFIRLNHEYIADEAALKRTSDPAIYKAALLNQMFSSPVFNLSNSFSYSLNKKRFEMMEKIITSPYRKLKVLFVLPVIAILLFAFATPEYHYSAAADNTIIILQAKGKVAKEVKGIVVNEEGNPIKGATVIISGTPKGESTDASGRFTIGNVTEEAHLIISSKGCVSQYLEPAFSSEMTVKMLLDKGSPLSLLARASYKNGPYPLVILNGVESNKGIDEIDENEISSMSFFMQKNATDLFGEKGKNGVIIITTKKKSTESGTNKPAETNTATQQKPSASSTIEAKEVKGTVVQEDGKSLHGVTIEVNGESTGAISDAEGHFAIGNVPENASLVFSYGGYKTQILKALFAAEMSVKFLKDPDYKEQIKIRGFSTFTSDPKPLILIDGVESTTGMDMILPSEISSISVLKDASATAVFGAKGDRGVIIITTKKKAAGSVGNESAEANPATQQKPSASSFIVGKVVKGTVMQQDGNPLLGATIIVKGTTLGVSSDAKGYFRLDNVPDEALLAVSYVGFKSKVVKPDFASEMTITMMRDTIFSGYMQITRKDGKEARPLILLDGVITDIEVNKIDPLTIESINVLKEKFATDKYGEKAKDGAIEITTKKDVSPGNEKKMSDVHVIGYGSSQKVGKNLFMVVEEMPEFPGGGKEAMWTWISQNVKYPVEAEKDKITGTVYVNFVVSNIGKVKNVKVYKPVHPLLDGEALRVISNMPDWKPGSQNGKPVDVDYIVRVDFKLK